MAALPIQRRALETTPAPVMQCMEIWGGNDEVNSAISNPGLDIWVSSRPHRGDKLGGDIHYVSMCASGRISRVALADVAGHGDEVAELATSLRKQMRRHINTIDQTRFAKALNREFAELSERSGKFATALLAAYFSPSQHVVFCNAGHPRPLHYRVENRTWSALDEAKCHPDPERAGKIANLPLGVIAETEYSQFAMPLDYGDLVLIYSDALIEAPDGEGDMLGEAGLLDLVRELDASRPETVVKELLSRIDQLADGDLEDDATIIMLHHNSSPLPKQSMGLMMRSAARMLGLAPV